MEHQNKNTAEMKIQTLKLYCAVLFNWSTEVLFHQIVDKSFQQHSLDGVFQVYGTSFPNDLFCIEYVS